MFILFMLDFANKASFKLTLAILLPTKTDVKLAHLVGLCFFYTPAKQGSSQ